MSIECFSKIVSYSSCKYVNDNMVITKISCMCSETRDEHLGHRMLVPRMAGVCTNLGQQQWIPVLKGGWAGVQHGSWFTFCQPKMIWFLIISFNLEGFEFLHIKWSVINMFIIVLLCIPIHSDAHRMHPLCLPMCKWIGGGGRDELDWWADIQVKPQSVQTQGSMGGRSAQLPLQTEKWGPREVESRACTVNQIIFVLLYGMESAS